jgi:hypothetical protein
VSSSLAVPCMHNRRDVQMHPQVRFTMHQHTQRLILCAHGDYSVPTHLQGSSHSLFSPPSSCHCCHHPPCSTPACCSSCSGSNSETYSLL